MFGFGKANVDDQKEIEIKNKKNTIEKFLASMVQTSPEEAERISERMKLYCNDDKILPFEYKKNAIIRIKQLECEANMRVADKLIHEAALLKNKDQLSQRGKFLAESRRYFAKACILGCETTWKNAYKRLSETIMMSGGLAIDAPSRAKPK